MKRVFHTISSSVKKAFLVFFLLNFVFSPVFNDILLSSNLGAPLAASVAEAAFNQQINYQGKLTDTSNVAVSNGSYNIEFKLYTSLTGGTAIWTETWCKGTSCSGTGTDSRVTVSNGLFSTMLGSTTALTGVDFNQPLYLGVNIGGSASTPTWDGEMTPRKILGAVPAAFEAKRLNGLNDTQFLRTDTTNATSTASTFITLTQSGAGNILNLVGQGSASVFTALSSGNVGIGTTSPGQKLSVAGDILGNNIIGSYFTATTSTATSTFKGLSATAIAANKYITSDGTFQFTSPYAGTLNVTTQQIGQNAILSATSQTGKIFSFVSNDTLATISTQPGVPLVLNTAGSERIRIGTAGLVGIGTTTPWRTLSVNGSSDLGTNALAGYFTATSSTASVFPYASTTALTVSGTNGLQLASALNGPLQANGGLVSATTSVGVLYGGTGLTSAPSYGQLLMGNASNGYTLSATSSLGLLGSSTVSSLTSSYVPKWGGSAFSNSNLYDDGTNIGIGTTTGLSKLTVNGIARFNSNQDPGDYFYTNGISSDGRIEFRSADNGNGGNQRIFMSSGYSTGCVGFGNSADSASNNSLSCGGSTGNSIVATPGALSMVSVNIGGIPGVGTTKGLNIATPYSASGISTSSNSMVDISTFSVIANAATGQRPGIHFTALQYAFGVGDTYAGAGDGYSTRAMTIASSTEIGIGTSTPYAKLSLLGTSATMSTFALVPKASQTANILDIYNTASTPVLTSVITAAGKWGIGTTSPGQMLSVGGDILGNVHIGTYFTATSTAVASTFPYASTTALSVSGASYFTGLSTFANLLATGSSTLQNLTFINATGTNATTTNFFATTASSTNLFASNLAVGGNVLTTSGGNVGIGTASPNAKLHVSAPLDDLAPPALGTISANTSAYFTNQNPLYGLMVGSLTGGPTYLQVQRTDSATAYSLLLNPNAGNVGIGTTSPATTLSVAGSGYFTTGIGAGVLNTTTGTIKASVSYDTSDSTGLYKINGSTMLSASTTNANYFFGTSPATLQTTFSGTNNFGLGLNDLNANTTGSGNVAMGRDAMLANTTGATNVAIGYLAFRNATTSGSDNVAIGNLALAGTASVANTGSNNVAIGPSALFANTSGASNVAIGPSALASNTTGQFNIGIGNQAMTSNAAGQNNTVLGVSSMKYTKTGNYNVAIGTSANQYNMSATSTTIVGEEAAQGVNNVSYFQNVTALGYRSLYAITTADDTTAVGYGSGGSVTSGVQNTFVGSNSGGGVTTGSGNTLIGYNTTATGATISNAIAIGSGASVGCSNCAVLGGTSGSAVIVGVGTSTPYAKLSIQNGVAATTTMALVPAALQTANILDIYNTASTPVLTSVITSAGKWGIGTTSPGQMLSVGGDILGNVHIGTYFTATSTTVASTFPYASTTALSVSGASYFTGLATLGNASTTQIGSTGSAYFVTSGTGSVGIGTTSPATTLSVVGSIYNTGGIGVGKLNTTANTIDLGVGATGATSGLYKINGTTVVSASSTLSNFFFGTLPPTLSTTMTGSNNNGIGAGALNSLTTGLENNAIGVNAAANLTTGQYNIAIGRDAMLANTVGNRNIAIGYLADRNATSSSVDNIMIGQSAGAGVAASGRISTSIGNIGIGNSSLKLVTSGTYNTAVGYGTASNLADGSQNMFFGAFSGAAMTSGGGNAAIGYNAMGLTTSGSNNLAVGTNSLMGNITGIRNVCVGTGCSQYNQSATSTVAIGYAAAQGSSNYSAQGIVAIGDAALSSVTTASDYNTAIGYQAGYSNANGTGNTYIGASAGVNNTSGSNNIMIGRATDFAGNISYYMNIGNFLYATSTTAGSAFGSFGIATTTPSARFSIKGLGTGTGRLLAFSDSSNVERLTMFDNGNVGIGTTSPWRTLSVNGSSDLGTNALAGYFTATSTTASTLPYASTTALSVSGASYFTGLSTFANLLATGSTTLQNFTFVNATGTSATTTNFFATTASSTNLFASTANLNAATIGTTLGVTGATTLSSTLNVTGLTTLGNASTTQIGSTGSAYFATSGGNVGIGTTSPGSKLDVNGDINANTYYRYKGGIFVNASSTKQNMFVGMGAGNLTTTGIGNTAIGYNSGAALTTQNASINPFPVQADTFIGTNAGAANTSGDSNVFVGYNAGAVNTCGRSTVAIGAYAGASYVSEPGCPDIENGLNVFIGSAAGQYITAGLHNVFIGEDTGLLMQSGSNNTFLGSHAGTGILTGNESTYIGGSAGDFASTTGDGNIGIGVRSALYLDGSAQYNVFLGNGAGAGTEANPNVASFNTAVGTGAGYLLTTATGATFLGYQAGLQVTTGYSNTLVGYQAGWNLVSGVNNTFLGYQAGYNTTGSANIFLGDQAGASNTTGSNQFVAGGDHANYLISDVYFGRGINSATPSTYTIHGTGGLGTNITGGDINIAGGAGTGSGVGGNIIFQTSNTGSSGTTLNTLSEKIRITNSGKIGIGTTTPWRTLSVNGSSDLGTNALAGYFTATSTTASTLPYASTTALSVSGASYFTGLSTFANLLATGSSTLQNFTFVNATGTSATTTNFFATTASSTNLFASTATFNAASIGTTLSVTGLTTLGNASTTQIGSTGSAYFATSGGNVGIGTTTPDGNLTVYNPSGASTVDIMGSSAGSLLRISQGSTLAQGTIDLGVHSPQAGLFRSGGTSGFVAYDTGTGDTILNNVFGGSSLLRLNYGGTTALAINSSGNVGIGTTSPGQKLSVAGDILGNVHIGTYFTATSTAVASTFPYASTTALSVSGASYFTGLSTFANLLATGSTTLQNFTFVNATGTNATTTNFFATTASSTNLFASTATLNTASIANTLNVTGLTTLGNASTTQIGSTGSAYFATSGGNVGIGTTSPTTALLAIQNSSGHSFDIFSTANGSAGTAMTINVNTSSAKALQINSNTTDTPITVTHVDPGNVRNADIFGINISETLNSIGNIGANDYKYGGGNFEVTQNASPATAKDVFGVRGVSTANNVNFTAYGGYFSGNSTNGTAYGVYSAAGKNYFNGNLGIGTTTPGQKLSVAGDILGNNIIGSYFTATSTTASSTLNSALGIGTTTPSARLAITGYGTADTGRAFAIANSSNAEKLYVTDSGKTRFSNFVAINSDPSTNNGTGATLYVKQTTGSTGFPFQVVNTSDTNLFSVDTSGNTNTAGSVTASANGFITSSSGGAAFLRLTHTSGRSFEVRSNSSSYFSIYDATASADRLVVAGIGTVGIGTTTPYAQLSIVSGAAATTTLALKPAASQTANILDIYSNDATPVLKSVITAAGKFGLGTTSPWRTLSVNGSSDLGTNALAGYFTATSSTASVFTYASTTAISASGSAYFATSGGNVGIGTTSPWRTLSVNGSSDLGTNALAGSFTATSTTATSTFAGFIDVNGTGSNATSTFASNLWVKGAMKIGTNSIYLNGAATSTFGAGINLTTGCFSVNGTCVGGSSAAVAIGSAITGGTAGSALFVDVSGNIAQDNTNFFWDNSSKYLGIQTATPGYPLDVNGTAHATTLNAGTITDGAGFTVTGGTIGGGVWNGTAIGTTYGGTGINSSGSTGVAQISSGTWSVGAIDISSSSNVTGTLSVANGGTGATSYTAGSITFSDGTNLTQDNANLFWNNSSKYLGIQTATPGYPLDVNGTAHATTLNAGTITDGAGFTVTGGTIGGGVWNGTAIGTTYGGTGINSSGSTGVAQISSGTWSVGAIDISSSSNVTGTLSVANGGTGATSYTAGSITFSDGTNLTQDNANLFWNNSTKALGIGDTAPGAKLSVVGNASIGYATGQTAPTNGLLVAGSVGIATTSPSLATFTVEGGSGATTAFFTGSVNSYQEVLNQNRSNGTSASTDFVAVNNIGNASSYYVNLGINSSGNADPSYTLFSANDAYLYSSDSALNLGTASTTNTNAVIKFFTAGTVAGKERARFSSTGNFGIGTTSPGQLLSVAGDILGNNIIGSYFTATSTTATSTLAGGFTMGSSGLNAYANGKVGIGTTTPQWLLNLQSSTAPQLALSAGAGIAQWAFRNAGGDLYFSTTTTAGTATTSTAAFSVSGSGFGTTTLRGLTISGQATSTSNVGFNLTAGCFAVNGTCVGSNNGTSQWTTTGSDIYYTTGKVGVGTTTPWANFSVGTHNLAITTPSFVIASSSAALATSTQFIVTNGKVGIGTSTPNWMLQVANTRPSFALSDTNAGANLKHWTLSSQGGNFYFATSSDALATSTTPAGMFNSSGWFGIGTTSPWAPLSVAGISAATSFYATATTSTSTMAGSLNVGNGALFYDYAGAYTSIDNLQIGAMAFDTNAGAVSWADMPITSAAAASTTESYTAQLGGNAVLTIYGEADGAGGVNTLRVGIGTTSPAGAAAGPLTMASGAYVTTGGTWTNASSRAGKENFTALDSLDVLQKINALDVTRWNYKSESAGTTHIGPVAEDFYAAFGTGSGPGSISTIDPSGVALIGIQALSRGFDISHAGTTTPSIQSLFVGTTTPALSIDAAGNIGIGTSSPAYKLHVLGDIAATSFVNISTREAKKDISYLSAAENESALNKIKGLNVATYRYNIESESNPLRLGLIAEEAPAEILAASGKGVDIYKLSTFILAGVKAQQVKIESLESRVAHLEAVQGGGSTSNGAAGIAEYLSSMGAQLSASVSRFRNVLAESLTVGTAEKPSGITLYDEVTKQPYCLKISGGAPVSVPGECAAVSAGGTSGTTNTTTGGTTPGGSGTTTTPVVGDTVAPVITINGNNPANIDKGASYNDLGVTVTDNIDNNLGITTTGDQIDTTVAGTYTVHYSATDAAGNTTNATRTVIVSEVSVPSAAPDVSVSTSTTTP
ncbi:MAG: immunoglobulin-like domain-containing protein [bacterium]